MSGVQFNPGSCGINKCQANGAHKVKSQAVNPQGAGVQPAGIPSAQPGQQNYNIKPGGLSLIG